MRFMIGIVVAGFVVLAMNAVFLTVAFQSHAQDGVVQSYEDEAR